MEQPASAAVIDPAIAEYNARWAELKQAEYAEMLARIEREFDELRNITRFDNSVVEIAFRIAVQKCRDVVREVLK